MATDLKISNSQELELWLRDRPPEWSQGIALRAALRVWPLVFHAVDGLLSLADQRKQALILQSWRAAFISSVAGAWPIDEMKRAAADAARAARAARVAAYAVDAAADAVDAADAAADAADAAADAARAARVAAAGAADAAARAAADAARAASWKAIHADCQVLAAYAEQEPKAENTRAVVDALMAHRLWIPHVAESVGYQTNFPEITRSAFDTFKNRDDVRGTPWHLLTDWYAALIDDQPRNIFANERGRELALKGNDFWEIGDGQLGEDVLAAAAVVLGWPEEYTRKPMSGSVDADDFPEPLNNIASPISVDWNADYVLSVIGDGLGQAFVPENRSVGDAQDRLDAARTLANDLFEDLSTNAIQARQSYRTSLTRYRDRLPANTASNIYLADTEMRTLRNELERDMKLGMDDRLAERLTRLIEAHYGLRPYFPELLNFYDDVRAGHLAEPPPIQAFEGLQRLINDNTPTVFDPSIASAVDAVSGDPVNVLSSETGTTDKGVETSPSEVSLPPDPIKDIDPERAAQRGLAGIHNEIGKGFKSLEKGGKVIDRVNKVSKQYGPLLRQILDWVNGSGGA